tara:strand:+ start:209 stop:790 length:582 start_codon:yes stop_codon:yes gene_type:complete
MTNEYDFNYGSGRPGMNVSPPWSVHPKTGYAGTGLQGYQGYQDNSPGAFQFRQTMADGQQTFAEMMGGYGQGEDFLPSDPSSNSSDANTRGNWKQILFGKNNQDGTRDRGALMPMLNTFTGLASAYLGMKQYGLAKDSFKQSKKEFGLNYDAQRNITNQQIAGIAKSQYSANPDFYDKPEDVINQYSVRERTA